MKDERKLIGRWLVYETWQDGVEECVIRGTGCSKATSTAPTQHCPLIGTV